MNERTKTGKWFGLLVFLVGILLLLADFSESFDLFGVSGWPLFFLLAGILLLSRQNPMNTERRGQHIKH
ncbi:MAG: hypothetical protein ACXAD7_16270 [Candidatus Kariarchaeaceae archaeon]|jgi:drug/metabolite transporter (DMT)-like permease